MPIFSSVNIISKRADVQSLDALYKLSYLNSTVRHVSLLFLEVGGTVLCVQEDFILTFSRILSELVGIPLQLVCCFSIYLFFFFSFLYNHEYDGRTRR